MVRGIQRVNGTPATTEGVESATPKREVRANAVCGNARTAARKRASKGCSGMQGIEGMCSGNNPSEVCKRIQRYL